MGSSGHRSDDDTLHLNRRDVLRLSSLVALAGTSAELQGCDRQGHRRAEETDRLRVARDEDMAVVEIGLVGMTRSSDDTTLSWTDNQIARLVLYFQPQHILEGAYWNLNNPNQPTNPDDPVPTRLSGESRLVFQPDTPSGSIPLTFSAILDHLRSWIPVVDPRALPPADVAAPSATGPTLPATATVGQTLARLRQRRNASTSPSYQRFGRPALTFAVVPPPPPPWVRPSDDVTQIELPFRLLLSPSRFGRFLHPTGPVEGSSGVVGLWTSRLAAIGPQEQPAADRFDSHRTVRAIWARDLDPPTGGPGRTSTRVNPHLSRQDPFRSPLGAVPPLTMDDRADIAVQSSHTGLRVPGTNVSKRANPMRVDRLWLSALGGGLDVRGEWTDSDVPVGSTFEQINLVKWVNKTTLGRDHYVEVQRSGYLWPTGNRAVYVEVTERRVRNNKAVLHKRGFIVVGEVTKAWTPTTQGDDATWRRAPLRSVTFLDAVVECDQITDPIGPVSQQLVTFQGPPATARALVEDRLGSIHETRLSFVFFTSVPAFDPSRVGALNAALAPADTIPMGNQRVAYADEGDPAGVMHETASLQWEGLILDNQIFPLLVEASLVVDAARSLLQNSATGQQGIPMVLHDSYLQHGLGGNNPDEVLFGVAPNAVKPVLDFAADSRRSGGFVAPNFEIGGLSACHGVVGGDIDDLAANGFDATKYFEGALPKLFGVLSLADMLSGAGAPQLLSSAAESLESLLADVDRLERIGDVTLPPGPAATVQATLDEAVSRAGNALGHAATADFEPLKTELAALNAALTTLQSQMAALPSGTDPVLKPLQPLVARLLEVLTTASSIVDGAAVLQNALEHREIKLSWEAPLDPIPSLFLPGDPLVLEVVVNAGTGGVDMTARLDNFELSLFGLVNLPVERFSLLQRSGSKPDIDVKLGSTEFLGMLAFVQALMEVLPLDGFSDPPAIEVDETGLTASLSLPLPNLAVGAFSIENMNLSASLDVPFIGDAILFTFGFCTRENPFVLTVMCIGGGGFFGIEVTPNGLRVVEVALEARASLSLDFGVASGSVSLAVGIYMNLHMGQADEPEMTLEGYVRIRGEVCVLGLISASLMLRLTLSYQSQGNKMYGEAEMTIEVSVLCFSASVTVHARRKLSGDNQDPTFLETMAPQDPDQPMLGVDSPTAPWALYVNAFAA